jgi:hypothetical protein
MYGVGAAEATLAAAASTVERSDDPGFMISAGREGMVSPSIDFSYVVSIDMESVSEAADEELDIDDEVDALSSSSSCGNWPVSPPSSFVVATTPFNLFFFFELFFWFCFVSGSCAMT